MEPSSSARTSPSSTLVIAVRGWTTTGDWLLGGRPGGEFRPEFVKALKGELAGAEVWSPELDLGMFSMRSAESLCRELFEKISRKIAASEGIEHIVLLGYSMGSVLARRVFCMAHGAGEHGRMTQPPAPWAEKIDRMVVLAGITRGWEFSSASPAHVRFLGPVLQRVALIGGLIGGLVRRQRKSVESRTPLIWQLRRGAPFVISARIQYVTVFEELRQRGVTRESPLRVGGLPSTVFIVGAKDEYLSPADSTELGPRIEFAFIELEGSNHAEALLITGESWAATERRKRLAAAITRDFVSLNAEPWSVPAGDIDDYLDPMDIADDPHREGDAGGKVEHAVMVVHGIRDNGFWTKRVAREIKTLGRKRGVIVRAPTPSYGYFSMWDFVKPGGRTQATYWFMERYADVRSHFPRARISFVGHSNGTYIAARALELCSAIEFDSVVFAGSVVRRNFEWARFKGRVKRVLNYVGSGDGVVAFLPAAFEWLRLRFLDVGGAGAFGFKEAEPPPAVARPLPKGSGEKVELTEMRFVRGGHGAAIKEAFWPEIAGFALFGELPKREPLPRGNGLWMLFRCAPPLTMVGIVLAVALRYSSLILAVVITAHWVMRSPVSLVTVVGTLVALIASFPFSWLVWRFAREW